MKTFLFFALPLAALASASLICLFPHRAQGREQKQKKQCLLANFFIKFLYTYGRRVIYTLSLIWAFGLFYMVAYSVPTTPFALTILMRYFGLTALFLIYIVLTPGLLLSFFPRWQYNGLVVHLRRALGVSVFFFVLLHATIGFLNN